MYSEIFGYIAFLVYKKFRYMTFPIRKIRKVRNVLIFYHIIRDKINMMEQSVVTYCNVKKFARKEEYIWIRKSH